MTQQERNQFVFAFRRAYHPTTNKEYIKHVVEAKEDRERQENFLAQVKHETNESVKEIIDSYF
ncbi:MAG: hypothetical protein VZR53_09390 [Prevotella sp.]|jgi:predicted chitinase|nr:hypothetical protein [Prevotella sp.]